MPQPFKPKDTSEQDRYRNDNGNNYRQYCRKVTREISNGSVNDRERCSCAQGFGS